MLGDCGIRAMVATAQPDAAKRFYTQVLGLRLQHDDNFLMVFEAGGSLLHLQKVEAFTPHPFTVLGWSVPDIHAAIGALRAKGVRFERFEGMTQDEDGVWIPPGGQGGVCWFKDPDGNLLSLSQIARP
jgi:catechol 2,3-dioxygenase-like lactoylglutathione lyase family enzyme